MIMHVTCILLCIQWLSVYSLSVQYIFIPFSLCIHVAYMRIFIYAHCRSRCRVFAQLIVVFLIVVLPVNKLHILLLRDIVRSLSQRMSYYIMSPLCFPVSLPGVGETWSIEGTGSCKIQLPGYCTGMICNECGSIMIVLSVYPVLCVAFAAPLRMVLLRKCLEILWNPLNPWMTQNSKTHENMSKPNHHNHPRRDANGALMPRDWETCLSAPQRDYVASMVPSYGLLPSQWRRRPESGEEWWRVKTRSSIGSGLSGFICVPSLHE